MELMIRVYEELEDDMFKMSNKVFMVSVEAKNVTKKIKEKIVEAIKKEGFHVQEQAISKYNIVEEFEIYDSGALSYNLKNSGGFAQDYKFIDIK